MDTGALTTTTCALIDLRELSTFPKTIAEVQQIVDAAARSGSLPRVRAYLTASNAQYGFVRQLQALAPPEMQIAVFTDEQEALVWLAKASAGG